MSAHSAFDPREIFLADWRDRAAEYRAKAAELREQTQKVPYSDLRAQMLALALLYDRLSGASAH